MNIRYANACTEVLTLFDYFLDEDDFNKIPQNQIDYMKKISNPNYVFIVDKAKSLEEQVISNEGKAIIVSLYKKYFADIEEERKIDQFVRAMDIKKHSGHTNFGRYEDLNEFQEVKKVDVKEEEIITTNEKSLVKNESLWNRIWNKILSLIHKK